MRTGKLWRLVPACLVGLLACADDDDPPVDPPPPETQCFVEVSLPDFQDTDVDVVSEIRLKFSVPIEASTPTAAAFELTHLDRQTPLAVDVALDPDGQTIVLTPQASLAFFADYAVDGSGVVAADGTACQDPAVVFSTRDPAPVQRPLRPAAISGFVVIGDTGIASSPSYRGLQIYDLSSPTEPVLVSEVLTEQGPSALRASTDGSYVYATAGRQGVLIFDTSDPTSPLLVGVAGTPGEASEAIPFDRDSKRYLAIADGTGGLRIIDVTMPEGPKDVVALHPSGQIKTNVVGVDLQGNLLATAQLDQGFSIVDITSIGAPSVVVSRLSQPDPETFDVSAPVTDVEWGEGTLWVSEANHGIQVFDVATPANPVFIDHTLGPQGLCASGCPDALQSHVSSGANLFAASAMTGGVRFGLSGGAIVEEARFTVSGRVNSATLVDDLLYLGTEAGLAIFGSEMTSNEAPLYLETNGWGVTRAVSPSDDGQYVYVASTSRGLETYQLISATEIQLLDLDVTPGVEKDIGVVNVVPAGNRLLVGDGRAGFQLFDITAPDNPISMGELSDVDAVSAIVPGNGVVYACDDNKGLLVIDVAGSAPQQLAKPAFNTIVGACRELELVGNHLYVAGGNGIAVLDISTPADPTLAGTVILPADDAIGDLAYYDGYLLASTAALDYEGTLGSAQRFLVFDIADPVAPIRIFKSEDLAASGPIVVRGDKAFVAGGPSGILVWGLADPTEPVLEGTIEMPGSVFRVSTAHTGDLLYVAQRAGGIGFVPTGVLP